MEADMLTGLSRKSVWSWKPLTTFVMEGIFISYL